MINRKGIPVSPGISIAECMVLGREEYRIQRRSIEPGAIEGEVGRLHRAIEAAASALDDETARLGEDMRIAVQVLESHRAMILDPSLRQEAEAAVRERRWSAEFAVSQVLHRYAKVFSADKSGYLADRIHDLQDIERKILEQLLGRSYGRVESIDREVVVISRSLSPSETAALDKTFVKGFAVDVGGRTSHTAILARALQIPAVVGLEDVSAQVHGGELVIIDGHSGQVIVDPDEKTLESYRNKALLSQRFYEGLHDEVRWPAETLDGYQVFLSANIEFPDEVPNALDWGAVGVGLYRTEFLFAKGIPDEEAHLASYREAVRALGGAELTIRTLDAGADKFHEEAVGFDEPNPFLGCRSLRLCFQRPELFRAQVRAALRVSTEGPVKIMLPMASSLEEIRAAKELIRTIRSELLAEGVRLGPPVPIGVMVEVPSLALVATQVAQEVDFFSIGTNDLIQYCLAVDRVNERVAHLYQPSHPAILDLIQRVIEAGRKHGIPVSICGEMCSEPIFTVLLLGLGLRSFSVSPIAIPTVKRVVRQLTISNAVAVAKECLRCEDAPASRKILEDRVRDLVPELLGETERPQTVA